MRFSYLKYGNYLDVPVFLGPHRCALRKDLLCDGVGLADAVCQTHTITN
jgi:hypothetical protein